MRSILAIALKDLRLLVRDRSAFFFTIVFPILVAIFFGVIFGGAGGGGTNLDVALLDEDGGPDAAAMVAEIEKAEGLDVRRVTDREAADTAVRKGKAVAAIIIPKGFVGASDAIISGRQSEVELIVDPRHHGEAGLLAGKITEVAYRRMFASFTDPSQRASKLAQASAAVALAPGLSDEQRRVFAEALTQLRSMPGDATDADADGAASVGGMQPVRVKSTEVTARHDRPTNAFEVSFAQGVVWGLMGCVTAFGVSLAEERQRGTLMRLTTAPITRCHVLAGKALACFIACLGIQALLLAVIGLGFGLRPQQPVMLGLAFVLSAFGFTGVMMLMAGMSRTHGGASGMGRAAILLLAMIGGGTIPLFFMPPIMQTVSKISPFSWANEAIEGGLWRQFGIGDMMLRGAVLLAFGAIGFVGGAMALRWSERS